MDYFSVLNVAFRVFVAFKNSEGYTYATMLQKKHTVHWFLPCARGFLLSYVMHLSYGWWTCSCYWHGYGQQCLPFSLPYCSSSCSWRSDSPWWWVSPFHTVPRGVRHSCGVTGRPVKTVAAGKCQTFWQVAGNFKHLYWTFHAVVSTTSITCIG